MAYPACAVAFVGGVPSLFPAGAPLPGGTAAASAADAQIKVELKTEPDLDAMFEGDGLSDSPARGERLQYYTVAATARGGQHMQVKASGRLMAVKVPATIRVGQPFQFSVAAHAPASGVAVTAVEEQEQAEEQHAVPENEHDDDDDDAEEEEEDELWSGRPVEPALIRRLARQAGVTEPAQSMIRRVRREEDGREEEGSTDEERQASRKRRRTTSEPKPLRSGRVPKPTARAMEGEEGEEEEQEEEGEEESDYEEEPRPRKRRRAAAAGDGSGNPRRASSA